MTKNKDGTEEITCCTYQGKKATVVNAVLTYKPSACYCCGVKNEGQIHKQGGPDHFM